MLHVTLVAWGSAFCCVPQPLQTHSSGRAPPSRPAGARKAARPSADGGLLWTEGAEGGRWMGSVGGGGGGADADGSTGAPQAPQMDAPSGMLAIQRGQISIFTPGLTKPTTHIMGHYLCPRKPGGAFHRARRRGHGAASHSETEKPPPGPCLPVIILPLSSALRTSRRCCSRGPRPDTSSRRVRRGA